jgi:peptide/nickel transport system ATP-binding protein
MYAGRIVELGPTEASYARPRHPYTAALLASVTSLWQDEAGPFRTIEGAPPPPGERPEGCAYRPRCARAFAPCTTRPELAPAGDARVACWAVAAAAQS